MIFDSNGIPVMTVADLKHLQVSWEIGGIADPIGQIANWIVTEVGKAITTAKSLIVTGVDTLISTARIFIAGLISSISSVINNVWAKLQTIVGDISKTISGIVTSIQETVGSIVSRISASLSTISASINTGFQSFIKMVGDTISGIGSALSSIGATITSALQSSFRSVSDSLNSIWKTLSDTVSDIIKGISSSLAVVGSTITIALTSSFKTITDALNSLWSGLQTALKEFVSAATKLGQWVTEGFTAFAKNPIGTINTAISNAMKALGLPTLGEISEGFTSWVSSWWNSKEVQDGLASLFKVPEEVTKFLNLGVKVLTAFTEEHSPSVLDNIILTIKYLIGLATPKESVEAWNLGRSGKWGLLGAWLTKDYDLALDEKGAFTWTRSEKAVLDPTNAILQWLRNLGGDIFKGLQDFGKTILESLNALGNWMVDGLIETFKLPKPEPSIVDPFPKLLFSIQKKFEEMAKTAKTNTPVELALANEIIGLTTEAAIFSEALEWSGLAVDVAHPLKNLQLKDKFEKFFQKIGLGNVTGVLGSTLVAASLAPVLRRYWNKVSQVQLPSSGELVEMWHRDVFAEKTLDEYLKEHGLDKKFADGVKELSWKIPSFDTIVSAYMKFVNDEKIKFVDAEKELKEYLKVFDFREEPREGFSFSEKQMMERMIFRGASRFERRSLNAAGVLVKEDLEKILRADALRPDLIPALAKAEILQGSATFRGLIVRQITERLQKGFVLDADFEKVLKEAEYNVTAIGYLNTANQLDIQTTIDEARLKEADADYTQGFMEKPDFEKIIGDVIKNSQLRKEHVALADIVRRRFDQGQIREESDRVLTLNLALLSEGAMTDQEFVRIAASLDRAGAEAKKLFADGKPEEAMSKISKEGKLLLEVGKLALAAKVRATKFKTLQTKLAKNRMSAREFVDQVVALPMNKALAEAAKDRILIQLMPKLK